MDKGLHSQLQKNRKTVYAAAVLIVILFYLLWYMDYRMAQSIKSHLGVYFVPVLAAFTLYFRGFRDGKEIRLLIFYSVWLLITRFLNRDFTLAMDGWIVVDSLLMFCFASFAPIVGKEKGERALVVLAAAAGIYCFVLGCICVFHWVRLDHAVNPITGAIIGIDLSYSKSLIILGENRNIAAVWFYISACLAAWLLSRCRRKIWRIPIILVILVDYLVIAGCYSRNVKMVFSVSVGLILFIRIFRYGKISRASVRALVSSIVLLASIFLVYMSFDLTTQGVGLISSAYRHREIAVATHSVSDDESEPEDSPDSAADTFLVLPQLERDSLFEDAREITDDNGRLRIYRTIPAIFKRFPMRLIKGCLDEDRMNVTDGLVEPVFFVHLHNSYLDVLNYTGVPGLILALAFSIMLLKDMALVFFSRERSVSLADRILVIPLVGILCYSMLETLIFMKQDFRSLTFFLLSGFVILEARRLERS